MEDVETIHESDTVLPEEAQPPAAESAPAASAANDDGAATAAGVAVAATAPDSDSASSGESESETEEEAEGELEDASEIAMEDDDTALGDVLVAEAIEPAQAIDPEDRLKAIIEAAIYVTDEPLSAEQIAKALDQSLETVQNILARLVADYALPSRGLTVREVAGGYKMATKPEHHEDIRKFVRNLQPVFKLSLAALETLAVIAYKQPVTAPEIMEIRGVQGAGVLKTLLDRKLIATAGRKDVLGKPILYKTTKEFLLHFGLSSLAELPTLKEFEELGRLALTDAEEPAGEKAGRQASLALEPQSEASEQPAAEYEDGGSGEDSAQQPEAQAAASADPTHADDQPPAAVEPDHDNEGNDAVPDSSQSHG